MPKANRDLCLEVPLANSEFDPRIQRGLLRPLVFGGLVHQRAPPLTFARPGSAEGPLQTA